MPSQRLWGLIVAGGVIVGMAAFPPVETVCRAEQQTKTAKQQARDHWEDVVQFFGDEETGEWSIRIRDEDVHARSWFEYLELWQFDRENKKWVQIKTNKFAKAIVLPKQKPPTDMPVPNQTLAEFKEIEPHTGGLWYAKWRIDDVEGGTFMRVGTSRTSNQLTNGATPPDMIKMAVPIDLNKSEMMIIPDPRIYCIEGGPGRPEGKNPPKAGK